MSVRPALGTSIPPDDVIRCAVMLSLVATTIVRLSSDQATERAPSVVAVDGASCHVATVDGLAPTETAATAPSR